MADRTVLVTGASGLLGGWIRAVAPSSHSIVGLTHRTNIDGLPTVQADLRHSEAVTAAFEHANPSLVIHAAYARDRASIVTATENVANAARSAGADLLFISTDAVFNGDSAAMDEDAPPDPVWDYGRWKAQSETIVLETAATAAIIRLPLIVSVDPDDHVVEHIRSSAARREQTTWFDDELRQPALASELAEAIWRIAVLDAADRAGAWHLPGPETLSRYEIATRVAASLGLDDKTVLAESAPSQPIRPRHINMRDTRAKHFIGWTPSSVLAPPNG